jgi:hypothetical protein
MANQMANSNPKAPKKANSRWTKEDDQRLIELARKGSTTGKIAKELGRTRSSIWARKHNLGIGDVRLQHSRGTDVPVSVGVRKRKSIAEVAEVAIEKPKVKRRRSQDSKEQLTLENVALIAKKHGLTVTFITIQP